MKSCARNTQKKNIEKKNQQKSDSRKAEEIQTQKKFLAF